MRSNGYSLARAALLDRAGRRLDDEAWPGAGHSLADELLRPSLIYSPAVRSLLPLFDVHAVAHITGGGLTGQRASSPARPPGRPFSTWATGRCPPSSPRSRRAAGVDDAEMSRTFNMGLGMVVVVPADQGAAAAAKLQDLGFPASVIGEVVAGQGRCLLE